MKRTDITPGTTYLAARGQAAATGGGWSRRKVIVLSNEPHERTRDIPAREEQRNWRGDITPGRPAVPAATTTFTGPDGPVTEKVTPAKGGGLPCLTWVTESMWQGEVVAPGRWQFELIPTREIVDTWDHAEHVLEQKRAATQAADEAERARRRADSARFQALTSRLEAQGVTSPLRLRHDLRFEATSGYDVAATLEALLDRLES